MWSTNAVVNRLIPYSWEFSLVLHQPTFESEHHRVELLVGIIVMNLQTPVLELLLEPLCASDCLPALLKRVSVLLASEQLQLP